MFCSSYITCKVLGWIILLYKAMWLLVWLVNLLRSLWVYGRKNTFLVAVKTEALTLEPWSVLELMIWGADDDSFRRDLILKGIEALD